MKNLFREAHKMAREITRKYENVDYRTQFGLCLSYLQEKEEEMLIIEKFHDDIAGPGILCCNIKFEKVLDEILVPFESHGERLKGKMWNSKRWYVTKDRYRLGYVDLEKKIFVTELDSKTTAKIKELATNIKKITDEINLKKHDSVTKSKRYLSKT